MGAAITARKTSWSSQKPTTLRASNQKPDFTRYSMLQCISRSSSTQPQACEQSLLQLCHAGFASVANKDKRKRCSHYGEETAPGRDRGRGISKFSC